MTARTGERTQADLAAFWKWLSAYKDRELGGTIAAHFLSISRLEDAFMAGLRAGRGQSPESSPEL